MTRLAIALHSQTITLGADGADAEAVLAFVCQGLRARPCADSRLELHSTSAHEFRLLRDGEPGEVAGSRSAAVELLMRELAIALVWDYSDGLALHAAAVELEGGAVLFPAISGTGKSTLAVYFAARGVRFLTDELVFLPSGTEVAHPLCRPAHLKPGSAFLLDEFPTLRNPAHSMSSAEGSFLSPAAFASHGAGPLPVRAIVFPRYSPGAACEVVALAPGVACFSLLAALVNARNLPELGVLDVARLVARVPAARISYGTLDRAFDAVIALSRGSNHA